MGRGQRQSSRAGLARLDGEIAAGLLALSENIMARAAYWPTPATRLTFIDSVILVILALLVRYAHVSIPVVSAHVFENSATWCCWWAISSADLSFPAA